MKQQKILLIGLLLLGFGCNKKSKEPAAATSAVDVSTADLIGKTWGATGTGPRYHLELSFADKVAKFESHAEGVTCGIADYSLSGNTIAFGKTRPCPKADDYVVLRDLPEQKCLYVVDPTAIQHTITLQCGAMSFGRLDSLLPAGRKVFHDGIELISEGWAHGETVTAAKFRSRPEKTAATIAYDPGNEMEGSKPKTDVIAAGTTVVLIGRTPDKHKVEKWENYWYFVEVYGLDTYRGWVFGELLKKK